MTHQPLHQDFREPDVVADERPHAVVIGSGFGGLAAAIRLGARGYRVTVLERLDRPGGRARVFRQDGFTFDAGPTIVTAPFLFEELWTLCGERMADHVTLKPLDACYAIRFADGEVFHCHSNAEAMRAEVERLSPDDLAGYDSFMAESEACCRTGFEEMADTPFSSLGVMARALPGLIRRRAYRSVHAMVSSCVKEERLRMALSFHPLFLGGNPFRSSVLFSLISHLERRWGVHYAMGGTGALVAGLADLIAGQGNALRLNAEVFEIVVETGAATGVRLAGGETIPADIVVSNADAAWTYRNLTPSHRRRRWTDRKLDRTDYSMSLFVWYFGTKRRFEDIEHHTILMGPRYEALLEDIFERKVLAEDFSLYLHQPTASDPSMAPEGCDAFYVLAPVPNLDGGTDWEGEAEPYRKKIERFLETEMMPGLADEIVTSRVMTPLDFERDYLSCKGAAFGFEPRLTQIAWFRPHNASEEVENLYIVGAGAHPGAGMPGVLSSARILDKVTPDATLAR